ncbi:aminopeptidase P family protein [Rhizobium halophytocola]|uniref:Xaa-Pro aminopeptidase n=1 Tax=Rhizobium halophytocola TaxID=735519 RepID=A0ABS4E2X7_9HYPH|nr:aminopeptidase P family protein [Rhizobium halophytocola]MBP1852305.1 Xaa-Pro aminopeptidase [Rhizobium halophytocola]
MFQSFEVTSTPEFGKARLAALRDRFAGHGIDAFLVPRADEYQGEYVPACSERLAWLTGFTGSAGMALVLPEQAIVFVDGRYTTQVAAQVDRDVFTPGDLVGEPPHTWLSTRAPKGLRLGIDPWLHSPAEVRRLEKALKARDGHVVLLTDNPLDAIWEDRPAPPRGAVTIQSEALAGVLSSDKIARIAADLSENGQAAVLITDPSSVAWIFNIRGDDVPHTPHPLARAIVFADGKAEIFLDDAKTNREVRAYLAQMAEQRDPEQFGERVTSLARGGAVIVLDPSLTPHAIYALIERRGGTIVEADDPAKLPRAIKNTVELRGSAEAHLQDGAAMVEYLYWLSEQPAGSVTEIGATTALEAARTRVGERMQNPLRDISFDTIAGAGADGAIIHYRVTQETDRPLKAGELFLLDSGGQYVNGTTDITRTVAIGDVPDEQKRFFTLVLKGMIGITLARFPKGTRGCDLDPLARIALWKAGGDYGHGTGHGVGSYLSVHEGPQRIARLATQALLPGMILSNEPGYYRPGAFGIRIENLIHVTDLAPIEGGDTEMMGFETLTFVPIDRSLILTDLLTREELRWLDDYHQATREKLMPLLTEDGPRQWLEQATQAFSRD